MVDRSVNKVIGEINSIAVQSYLKSRGWTKVKSKREHISIYTYEKGGTIQEIILPLSRDFTDYEARISDALKSISIVEEREYSQVLSDLLIAKPSDIIRIKVQSEDTKSGTILIEDGFDLLENTKEALYTTAFDLIHPEIFHRRLFNKDADEFIKNCRLGQTERGSFIASIICPFIEKKEQEPAKQFSLFDDPVEFSTSFTRKVTSRLMQSIKVINTCIENGELEKIAIGEADFIISANFLESIVKLKQINKDANSVEFFSTWSSLSPVKLDVPSRVEVQKDFVEAIDHVIDKMQPKDNFEVGEFVGKVFKAQAEPDLNKRTEGEVIVNLIGEVGKTFNAKLILDAEKYKEALIAHENGKNIIVKGKLVSGRRAKYFEEFTFSVIGEQQKI